MLRCAASLKIHHGGDRVQKVNEMYTLILDRGNPLPPQPLSRKTDMTQVAYTNHTEKINTYHTIKYSSREVNEARRLHTCSRPRAFEEKKNTGKSAPPKTHH